MRTRRVRRHHAPPPGTVRWVAIVQNTALVIAALATAYLVILAMMKTP